MMRVEPIELNPADYRRQCIIEEIRDERDRQMLGEGWTPAHDDRYERGELSRAAACYALSSSMEDRESVKVVPPSDIWLWDAKWWKPTTPRRDLVKAAALIIAEIERIDRKTKREVI